MYLCGNGEELIYGGRILFGPSPSVECTTAL
jgi:hypothetical protein